MHDRETTRRQHDDNRHAISEAQKSSHLTRRNDDPISTFSCLALHTGDLTGCLNRKHRIAVHLLWNNKRLFGFLE